MMTIWKFPLKGMHLQTIDMPKGAKIISVAVQRTTICLWVEVNPNEDALCARNIEIISTGQIVKDHAIERHFLGTILIDQDNYIFHVYERIGGTT